MKAKQEEPTMANTTKDAKEQEQPKADEPRVLREADGWRLLENGTVTPPPYSPDRPRMPRIVGVHRELVGLAAALREAAEAADQVDAEDVQGPETEVRNLRVDAEQLRRNLDGLAFVSPERGRPTVDPIAPHVRRAWQRRDGKRFGARPGE